MLLALRTGYRAAGTSEVVPIQSSLFATAIAAFGSRSYSYAMTAFKDLAICFTKARSVQAHKSEKGNMLLDVESDVCWELNATGGFIWGLIQDELSVNEIVERLAKQFALTQRSLRLTSAYF